jgi:tetratricopeptide (TPR) repeat protein
LLAVVAAALAGERYDPTGFEKSESGQALSKLKDDPVVGPGIKEMLLLHVSCGEPSSFSWWAWQGDLKSDPKYGSWPRDAFRDLIRANGDWWRDTGQPERARSCYNLANRLVEDEPDPQAVLALADLSIAQHDLEGVRQLAEREVPGLFYGKGWAYRHSQYAKIYQFHRALGQLYGALGEWGDSQKPDSAVFQLEHALTAAGQASESVAPDASSRKALVVDPGIYENLVKAYRVTGRTEKAQPVLDRAEKEYRAVGRGKEADRMKVLRNELPSELKTPVLKPDKSRKEKALNK